jgi:hypothetical protein
MDFQMRNKTLISSMVGVAAAVAVAGSANAAIVTIDNFQTGFPSSTSSNQSGSGILGTRYISNDEAYVPLSFVNPGINWSGSSDNGGYIDWMLPTTNRNLTNVVLTLTGSSGNGQTGNPQLRVQLIDIYGKHAYWYRTFSASMTMSTAAYDSVDAGFNVTKVQSINFDTWATSPEGSTLDYTMTNFSYAPVPAPGALALLGAAGLVGARRRRA